MKNELILLVLILCGSSVFSQEFDSKNLFGYWIRMDSITEFEFSEDGSFNREYPQEGIHHEGFWKIEANKLVMTFEYEEYAEQESYVLLELNSEKFAFLDLYEQRQEFSRDYNR